MVNTKNADNIVLYTVQSFRFKIILLTLSQGKG